LTSDAERAAARAGFDVGEVQEMRAVGRLLQQSVDHDALYEGTDSRDFIAIEVDARGVVRNVVIDPAWVHGLGPSELGTALIEAFQAANVTAVAASLERFRNAADAGAVERGVAQVAEEEAGPTVEENRDELLARLEESYVRLERTRARVDQFLRLKSVSSSSGLLRLDLDEGTMVGVTVTDRRRATQISTTQLGAEALSMFQAAAPPAV
jgi:hypothetical protein